MLICALLAALGALVSWLLLQRKTYEFPLSPDEAKELVETARALKRGIFLCRFPGLSAFGGVKVCVSWVYLNRPWMYQLVSFLSAAAWNTLQDRPWSGDAYWEISERGRKPLTRRQAQDLIKTRGLTVVNWVGLRVYDCYQGTLLAVCYTGYRARCPDQYEL